MTDQNQSGGEAKTEAFCFIVWLDDLGSEPTNVEILAFEDQGENQPTMPPPIGQGDFVVVYDSIQKQSWFGQVLTPQLNLPLLGVNRESPSNLTAMERVLRGLVSVTVFTRQVYYYQTRLLGQISGDVLLALRIRPRGGSQGRPATEKEVICYLALPAVKESEMEDDNVVAQLEE
jgi:hypothetical protein